MSAPRDPDDPRDPAHIERLLAEAFHAQADSSIGDDRTPPPPRFDQPDTHTVRIGGAHRSARRPHRRWLAPVAAAAAVVAVAGGAIGLTAALSGNGSGGHQAATQPSTTGSHAHLSGPRTSARSDSSSRVAAGSPVHVRLLNSDGAQYGIGMPVVAYFSRKITDAAAFAHATVVSVDGRRAQGAWYFESSDAGHGPIEGHLRLQDYWPAHANVHVALPVKGLSAGRGLAFDDSVTLDFRTGAANVSVVNDRTHRLTLTSDGKEVGTFPVSLGASNTPTARGTKVIMEKGASICMSGPGYNECGIRWTQRLTYGGEYLHSAPWNISNIDNGVDSSNGCTNLRPADAQRLYGLLEVGDVVKYPNESGPQMSLGAGFGDWNVPWSTWLGGGAVPTR